MGVIPVNYSATLAQGIIVVIVTYLTIIFGELVPKRIGLSIAEQAAKTVSRPMNLLSTLALPFVWLLSKSTELIFTCRVLRSRQQGDRGRDKIHHSGGN